MGNDIIKQTCVANVQICEQAHINLNQVQIKANKFYGPTSSQQLKQKIFKYVNQNQLYLLPKNQKKIFQILVSIGQDKLADKALKLYKESKKQNHNQFENLSQKWNKFLQSIQRIRVQDLDGFFQQYKMQQFYSYKQKIITKEKNNELINKMISVKELKILQKRTIKKNIDYSIKGNQILKENQLLIIVPVQCFCGIGSLRNKTNLPSEATLLQMLITKIKAVNRRRGGQIGIVFIVNEQFLQFFKKQIGQITGIEKANLFRNLQVDQNFPQHSSEQFFQPLLNYYLIPYQSYWPLFDEAFNIMFNEQKREIQFNCQNGDLLKFIETNLQIKQVIARYRYIQFTNLNNMLSQIGDATLLGYLQFNQQIDIAVKVLKPNMKQFQLGSFIKLDQKKFLDFQQNKKISQQSLTKSIYKQNTFLLNSEEYLIKSRLILNQPEPLKRLLLSRIRKQNYINFNQNNRNIIDLQKGQKYYFKRQFQDILYSKSTALILVQEQIQYSHVRTQLKNYKPQINKNGQLGYSLYCKKLLGIKYNPKNTSQIQQLVDIDAGILHKGYEQIAKLVNKLKKVQEIGFPLILYSDLCHSK